jgi:hypothetical protein
MQLMLKKLTSLWLILFSGVIASFSQSFIAPNVALKSHETLDIIKIVMSEENTRIYLKVENRISGGNFCADKNIWLVSPDGIRTLLISSNGIPVCPETYKFKTPGESLDFVLTFPPIKKGVESVNLIEDCQQNCFSFYGIILDNNLNKNLDDAFTLAENDEPARALVSFTKIAEVAGDRNPGAVALLYMNIVKLSRITGNSVKAAEWYKKMEASGLPETALYLKYLNSQGIKY